ncbi:YeiH family protein [Kribbella sp. NBC_01505]|uniref:YeiH family protein n=1 Tax=Kribbella sp. NBC_01505 TaxID=2903580 RepID=UPI00386EB946
MTTATAPAPTFTDRVGNTPVLKYVPGVLLLIVLGLIGKWAQAELKLIAKFTGTHLPDIEYVLWAILLGLLIANTVGVPRIFRPGVGTYEFWLKAGIVFLGARFILGDLAKVGGISLGLILIDGTIAVTTVLLLSKAFKLAPKLGTLLAIGTAICGVSAIIAGKGAIEADDEDSSYSIAAILALGAVALFTFPAIGHLLDLSQHTFGLWVGLAVDNTAETTATAAIYGPEAQNIAVLVKSTRNALIGFVVLGFASYWASRGQAAGVAPGFGNRTRFLWAKFPKFVLGYIAVSALATWGAFSKADITSLGNISKWAFLLTFAGVGLNTDLRAFRKSGWRPFIVGALSLAVVAITSLLLVLGATSVFDLE